MGTRWIVAVLAALVLSLAWEASGGPAAPSTPAAPPFTRGTTWTYRLTSDRAGGQTQPDSVTVIYRGEAAYRGRTYHAFETTTTLASGSIQRDYTEWAGTHFRQAATVVTDAQRNVTEIIFDQTFGIGGPVEASGTADVIVNGAGSGMIEWKFTGTPREVAKVTVPAGTFQARRWDTVLRLGEVETISVTYVVGLTAVREDAKDYLSGRLAITRSMDLVSGPVR